MHGNLGWYWVVRIQEAKSTPVYETALVEIHQQMRCMETRIHDEFESIAMLGLS